MHSSVFVIWPNIPEAWYDSKRKSLLCGDGARGLVSTYWEVQFFFYILWSEEAVDYHINRKRRPRRRRRSSEKNKNKKERKLIKRGWYGRGATRMMSTRIYKGQGVNQEVNNPPRGLPRFATPARPSSAVSRRVRYRTARLKSDEVISRAVLGTAFTTSRAYFLDKKVIDVL
jgi:hypothetical protein